jgi:hypothetical protein
MTKRGQPQSRRKGTSVCSDIRRLFAYPLPRPFGHLGMATVQQGSVVALLLTANILPLALRTRSWATLHRCAANLAVIDFIPLWTGWTWTFGFPAHLLGNCYAG